MVFQRTLHGFGILILSVCFAQSDACADLIAPEDPRIQLLGRFERSNAGKARFAWSGSTIRFRLQAKTATAFLGGAPVRYGLRLNGNDVEVWQGKKEVTSFEIRVPDEMALPVQVEIVRLNQPLFGESTFEGMEVGSDSDLTRPATMPTRWIEFIGDSITAGHGIEAPGPSAPLEAGTESFLKTYGYLTARALGAQPVAEAWSGIRLTRSQAGVVTMPERWGRTLPDDVSSKWDHSIIPDVVVINLGTNDFSSQPPDEATWKGEYRKFLQTIRGKYPKALIFCTNGPMLGGGGLDRLKLWTDSLVAELADPGIQTLYFPGQKMEDGIGGQWHPSMRTHAIMAKRLSAAIAAKTGWTATTVEVPPVTQATK